MNRIFMPWLALKTIFDECDRFQEEETGGRIIGAYSKQGGNLTMRVLGLIEAGPNARRTAISFFQDGEYQEPVFRQIERHVRYIQHLGNWHSHHVNGLRDLSRGDVETYQKNVNSPQHATNFFYALLITGKCPVARYSMRHFIFERGKSDFEEFPEGCIQVIDAPLLWPKR